MTPFFSHYNSMGAICCHENQSSELICTKTPCSLSPTQMMSQIKFDCDMPADLRDIMFDRSKAVVLMWSLLGVFVSEFL